MNGVCHAVAGSPSIAASARHVKQPGSDWLAVDLNPGVARPDASPLAVDALAIVGETHHPDWDYEDPGGRPGS